MRTSSRATTYSRKAIPSTDFYIIESGEVEVLRKSSETGQEIVLAVLGPGNFFGEMALLDGRDHKASIRAKTGVELTVMGKKVFEQISGTLKPFRDFLSEAVRKRGSDIWQRLPAAYEILEREPLDTFLRPVPAVLAPEDTFEKAVDVLEGDVDFCCIVDGGEKLSGIITHADLFRAVDDGVVTTTPASSFMNKSPVLAKFRGYEHSRRRSHARPRLEMGSGGQGYVRPPHSRLRQKGRHDRLRDTEIKGVGIHNLTDLLPAFHTRKTRERAFRALHSVRFPSARHCRPRINLN